MFTQQNKALMLENVRGAAKRIKKTKNKEDYEDIFSLMKLLPDSNGCIIEKALLGEGIKTYNDILERKGTMLIGILMHKITLKYIKAELEKKSEHL